MPSYPSSSIVHKLKEHSCGRPGCTNSKLGGASMRRCKQCHHEYYCSEECQEADWSQHKSICQFQAEMLARENETVGSIGEDYDAWRLAMGPMLFTWIVVNALAVFHHPEHIQTKFVMLSVKQKTERPVKALKMYCFKSILVFDRSALPQVCPGTSGTMEEIIHDADERARAQGKAGVAMLLTCVTRPDGKSRALLRNCPVVLRMEELQVGESPGWEKKMQEIIDEGRSIKKMIAKAEKTGMLN
ncbi:hypothetical protein GGX14DRAFT_696434 [Mycena pura]|uniref:MYND-type domain-containing protein n=1 Tax=Mycena pura TaxID=153505 RepID=A0AAD6YDY7_9AGAR|nr:hypothetical protein GGX14DRAFT_696434 [Mycena pura]